MQHQDESAPKVFIALAQQFGVTEHQLYRVWQDYCAQRAFHADPKSALDRMKMMPASFPPAALECFTILGLELFSREVLQKSKELGHGN